MTTLQALKILKTEFDDLNTHQKDGLAFRKKLQTAKFGGFFCLLTY